MNNYLGLVHHPIVNKKGETVTTSVTNLDIHDISRSCKTFGFANYFIVTPLQKQKELISRLLGHWEEDKALAYNPDRQDALEIARLVDSIEDAISAIEEKEGVRPLVAVTGANFTQCSGGVSLLNEKKKIDKRPMLLLFGTGWGLHSSVVEMADFLLEPIIGDKGNDYNHLSVRSAVAIYLDRITNQ
jgi:hypothetical protein